ncbi:hypothetical protein [Thalassovita sp.]|uniref:hypothetical protein n=1 Tax=Thalassovita sp. TaxID=1979401 RepID=UPI0028816C32|nr:hypothetical protein [Thalassovita sp.]MDF1803659.1 hypothetical protein [Thalassovita sp.]
MRIIPPIMVVFAAFNGAAHADQDQICKGDGMIADTIAAHRQFGGYTIAEMMDKLGSEPGLRAMILDAYGQPLMLTAETRRIAVSEFANKWTVKCYTDGPAIPRKE